jgi:hypothetical protein
VKSFRETAVCVGLMLLAVVIFLTLGEIAVRFINPRPYMYPRWQYSPDYGAVLFKNTTMIQERPGRWKYSYKINEYGYRGKAVPVDSTYTKDNILILGDSYSFGHGVSDGEEYAAVMQNLLKDKYNVINLAVGSYGLTQEIRRFYEFGQLYRPSIVILQFCGNDLDDNLYNRVTEIKNGCFVFQPTNNPIGWTKKYLSYSLIQKSQLYNLFRDSVYRIFRKRTIIAAQSKTSAPTGSDSLIVKSTIQEKFYDELLDLFARDLHNRGIVLIMISVNKALDCHPIICHKINELQTAGDLRYVEVVPWFEGVTDLDSPEGHEWGSRAHRILGERLTRYVQQNIPRRP